MAGRSRSLERRFVFLKINKYYEKDIVDDVDRQLLFSP